MTSEIILRKQVLELAEALRLTKASKEDALARAAAENQKIRDELIGAQEGWYTRYLAAADRATKAEAGVRELADAARAFEGDLSEYCDGPARDRLRAALRIKELLPP